MPKQIIFGATITPPTAPMEVTINSGASFAALAFTTVGSNQQGTLTNVPAGPYAPGTVGLQAVGYPGTVLYNSAALTVADAVSATYTTVNTQSFEGLTALPASYQQTAGFAVVTGEQAVSGTYAVKQTSTLSEIATGPTATVANGRFSVSVYSDPATSVSYPVISFNRIGTTRYVAKSSIVSGGATSFFLIRSNAGTETNLKQSPPLSIPRGWYRYALRRIGSVVGLSIQRQSDGFYLNSANVFASPIAEWATITDTAPLPATAGIADFVTYSEPGSVSYYDDALLESYA